jgi:hypothetical protein
MNGNDWASERERMNPYKHKPLPPIEVFILRVVKKGLVALGVIFVSVFIGAAGYHFTEGMSWLDAALNASMILTGMGPVDQLQTAGGKVFAIFYSLFSGVVFLTVAALLFAPVLYRFLHRFHLELEPPEAGPTDPRTEQHPNQPQQSNDK